MEKEVEKKMPGSCGASAQSQFQAKLIDICDELHFYDKHFKGKTILCSCDDPLSSAFWNYFHLKFGAIHPKKLIATCSNDGLYKTEYTGGDDNDTFAGTYTPMQGDGDFRNPEIVKLFKEADIVVTNPPFKLFREYVKQLMQYKKKFLILGKLIAAVYKDIFPLIRENRLWLGVSTRSMEFEVSEDTDIKKKRQDDDGRFWTKTSDARWFTNLPHNQARERLVLWKSYTPEEFPKYDNFDAIHVDRVADIPKDYDGIMGVPYSYIDWYDPRQFEILGVGSGSMGKEIGVKRNSQGQTKLSLTRDGELYVPYPRILIKRKIKESRK